MDILTYALAKKYVDKTVEGGGSLKGKNCIITDISSITGGNRVTFQWTLDDGTVETDTMDVMDGVDGLGIKAVSINQQNHLIITYDDDTTEDAGVLPVSEPTVITYAQWQALTPQQQQNGNYIIQNYPVQSGAVWGNITGTLSNQTDLKTALDAKFDASYFEIKGGGANLYDAETSHENWKPSTTRGVSHYTDGSTESAYTTNLIPCVNGDKFKFSCTGYPFSYMRYFVYDENELYLSAGAVSSTPDIDGYPYFQITEQNAKYFCLIFGWSGSASTYSTLYLAKYDVFGSEKVIIDELYFNDDNVTMAKERLGLVDDILYGKKWAVAGDSFTAGDFSGTTTPTIPSGKYAGQKAVYPYLIGNRCNMTIQNLSMGGRTLALPSGESSSYNSFVNQYQNVAADADYLTIYLGINDSHQSATIPIGTISDNTTDTFYGAWNVILSWLIENRPNLHIGIIVSNGCESDDYRVATIEIATKYGIPYIDMNGDKQTPCMIRSTNASIASAVRTQRTNNWKISNENVHPNAACHAFESVFIENFLRTL